MATVGPTVTTPGATTPQRPGPVAAETVLVVAWALIGLGASLDQGRYSVDAVLLVTVGTALVAWVVARRMVLSGSWGTVAAATAGVAVLGGFHVDAGIYGSGPALLASRVLTSVAAALVALWLVTGLRGRAVVAGSAIAVMAASGVAMIVASPSPAIDVWAMLQAADHGLSHGRDIYALKWTTGIRFEQSNGFAYLPGAAVVLWPFHALFGDVRYGLLTAMVLTAFLLVRLRPRSSTSLLGVLVVLSPKAMFGLEQSWVDPLVLLGVCATVFAVARRRHGWAVVAFAGCLVCKQQAWLLLPLALVWRDFGWRRSVLSAGGALAFIAPWAVAAPHAFWAGAISYNLDLPARLDSLSLFTTALSFGWVPGMAVVALTTLGAAALAVWRLPRDAYGFLLGAALVMAVFNLTNKQSFFNEWALSAGLVLAAVVAGESPSAAGPPARGSPDGAPVPTP